jgi:hypothetical protein
MPYWPALSHLLEQIGRWAVVPYPPVVLTPAQFTLSRISTMVLPLERGKKWRAPDRPHR